MLAWGFVFAFYSTRYGLWEVCVSFYNAEAEKKKSFSNFSLDASSSSKLGWYVNDSMLGNCKMMGFTIDNRPVLVLIAIMDITKNRYGMFNAVCLLLNLHGAWIRDDLLWQYLLLCFI